MRTSALLLAALIGAAAALTISAWLPVREMLTPPLPATGTAQADKDGEDDDALTPVKTGGGLPAVRLSIEEQHYTGIQTQVIKKTRHQTEAPAFARVLDLQPLLALRAEMQRMRSERAIAETDLTVSQEAYERLRILHNENANISTREVQQAHSRWQADKIRLEAAEQRLQLLRAKARQAWGAKLADDLLADGGDGLGALLKGKSALALLTLPAGVHLPDGTRQVFVASGGDRTQARAAEVISPAPMTGENTQGETWFLRAPGDGLRIGMRLHAWVPQSEKPVTGVNLPAGSIVWYAGRPWAYVQIDEELFARRPVDHHQESAGGWFVRSGFEPGETVVTRGAQMLLSEEFRAQIPEEDDD